jgi:sulfoacetaldehyde dehydrogenase
METPNNNPASISGKNEAVSEIEALVARARSAQAAIEGYTQEEADALATSVGWQVYKSREALAKLAVEEGGFGNIPDKITKIALRVLGTLADMASVKTCGIIEEDPARGLLKIAKPVGVIAALIPTTGPDATPPVKALAALQSAQCDRDRTSSPDPKNIRGRSRGHAQRMSSGRRAGRSHPGD